MVLVNLIPKITPPSGVSGYLVNASAVICALVCLKILRSWWKNRNLPPLPPGPKGLPLIGNFFDMPKTEEWVKAREWGQKYGGLTRVIQDLLFTLRIKSANDEIVTDEVLIARITGVSYAGGADTTISAMLTFLLAMLLHPHVQSRAQEELDRVVGKDNLPSFDDRSNLPYIDAVIKETLRWQIVSPLGMARSADVADEYNGHYIPAGVTILPNLWAILMDPDEFPEPEKFIPERWLPKQGKEPPLDVAKVVFGIGRRICPGRYFALNSIFMSVSSILTCFDINKVLGENGQPITPPFDYTTLFIRHAKPFRYELKPRSEKIALLVRHAVESERER